MDEAAASAVERGVALGGALIVSAASLSALLNDWNLPGLDNNVTKLMLGLMAFGCVLVMLAAFKVLGA